MRQRNVKNQDMILNTFDRYNENPEIMKGHWHDKYSKVYLEIGIGKGQFIYNMAKQEPDALFVGIELNKGVVALAIKKMLREEQSGELVPNIMLFPYDAIELGKIFEKGEVDKIFLNFSDPWPKKKHEKRRLTSKMFLDVYREILSDEGYIEQKTDNRSLFEYSIMSYGKNLLEIEEISLNVYDDIEKGKITFNIPTEYEEKFRDKGPIYKAKVRFKEV